jgi:hypothetical protein
MNKDGKVNLGLRFSQASLVVLCSFSFLATSHAVQAVRCSSLFEMTPSELRSSLTQTEISKNTFELLRSNAGAYWKFVGHLNFSAFLKNIFQHEGIIVGDPHSGNFSVVPAKSKAGRQTLRYLDIDFDDAGRGSFGLDFIKLAMAAKVQVPALKVKDILKSYISGLKGEEATMPKIFRNAEEITMPEYEKMADKYAEKNSSEGKFILKPGEIEAGNGGYSAEEIQGLFPEGKVLDVAKHPKDHGGSKDSLRLWILLKKEGHEQIYELKGYNEPAVAQYHKQPPVNQWFKEIVQVLWPNADSSNYDLIKTSDSKIFWKRPRKISLVELPKDGDVLSEANLYMAWYVGRLHGGQPQGASYLKSIEENPDQFREQIKPIMKQFVNELDASLE